MKNYPTQLRTAQVPLFSEPSVADILFVEFSWKPKYGQRKTNVYNLREDPYLLLSIL